MTYNEAVNLMDKEESKLEKIEIVYTYGTKYYLLGDDDASCNE